VLVAFSGGVDSALLAALVHRHVPLEEPIDLASVCFACGASADRLAALCALGELRAAAPQRCWRLICVDATLGDVQAHRQRLLRLLHPQQTLMDLNIGAALWLAARGEGLVDSRPHVSAARIVLFGAGADEQAAGYGRHRTAWAAGGAARLCAELELDVGRLWRRNLGRDDRLAADCGREARFPFLDEAVVAYLACVPLNELADFSLPPGDGDKLLLRSLAARLGLPLASRRIKRAIQFGCGLGRLSRPKGREGGRCILDNDMNI
jgi:asparagine synthetase B (glutamine-hydrolysing)